MKIEKLNENQIKCTLTRDDLAKRNLRISELAYGSEKTQNLFREMVKQADYEYGFETENIPLVVEAIPMNSDCIVLIITKVEDPEELDTRFSRFSPYTGNPSEDDYSDEEDVFETPRAPIAAKAPSFGEMLKEALEEETPKHSFLFSFTSLGCVIDFANQAAAFKGRSSLYKSDDENYLMTISVGSSSKDDFKNVCMLASEYANGKSIPTAGSEYMKEHCDVLIKDEAIKKLSGK